jgi:hypothetical protein
VLPTWLILQEFRPRPGSMKVSAVAYLKPGGGLCAGRCNAP